MNRLSKYARKNFPNFPSGIAVQEALVLPDGTLTCTYRHPTDPVVAEVVVLPWGTFQRRVRQEDPK